MADDVGMVALGTSLRQEFFINYMKFVR